MAEITGRTPENIYETTLGFIDSDAVFAACVVLESDGSTPAKAGWRAVIEHDGTIHGTLGGGKVELTAQQKAIASCHSGQAQVVECVLEGASADRAQPICGGRMRILIDPQARRSRDAYAEAAGALKDRGRGVLLTRISTSTPTEVKTAFLPQYHADSHQTHITKAVSDCLAKEKPLSIVSDDAEIFLEPVVPVPVLLIAGGGHVGQTLARQATEVGFGVVVFDDRPEFTQAVLFGRGVRTSCCHIAKGICDHGITPDTYIVIVTRSHQHDHEVLAACIASQAAYIGMIGSRRKVEMIGRTLVESGAATKEQWQRVFAPIGLDIGSVTAGEIAASIVGQLVAVRRKGRDYLLRSLA